MGQKMDRDVMRMLKQRKRKRFWTKVLSVMMCLIVFCTTYALILPAVTMETDTFCGIEAHTHAEECFEQVLICQIHVHSDDCNEEQNQLICTLPESEGHTHSDACAAHTEAVLSCSQEESQGHTHTETCVQTEQVLSCGQEESQGHSHSEQCSSWVMTCTLEEDETHSHTDSCYSIERTCGQAESEGHTHSDGCYTAGVTYVCGEEASEGHTHTDACYTTAVVYDCGQEEVQPHTHTDECYEVSEGQACTLEADPVHEHTEECYEAQPICQIEEHEHSLACYSDPEADVETASFWETTLPNGRSGVSGTDLLAVAKSQVGYTESTRNYIVLESGEIKGYTRYGAWYGNPYGDWSAMFVSFCIHYAGASEIPVNGSCSTWVSVLQGMGRYGAAAEYIPTAGDIIFFDRNFDRSADHVGIVAQYVPATESSAARIQTIEGDSGNCVRYGSYNLKDSTIMGYGVVTTKLRAVEDMTGVDDVIALIDAMPSADEIDAKIEEFEDAEDYEGEEAWLTETYRQVAYAYQRYSLLSDAQRGAVTNADKLLELEYIWSAVTLDEPAMDADDTLNKPVMNADGTFDLAQFLYIIKVERNGQNTTGWEEINYKDSLTDEVESGDALRFELDYKVPGKTLDAEHRTITYQLDPPLNAINADSGYVYNGSDQVGTYTISESGLITITFYEKYAKDNAGGLPITGYITFETSVEKIDNDESDDIQISLGDQTITLHITDKTFETADLQVDKSAGNVDLINGTLDYTITVTSQNGTGSGVTLNDVMTNVTATSNIVVKNKSGDTVKVTPAMDAHGNFTLELPKMEARDSYTITYSAELNNADTLNGTVTGTNRVDVKSTNKDGEVLVDDDTVHTDFTRDVISKSGALSAEGDTINWTITVNTSKLNIDGWTLSDMLNNTAYTGDVTITPNPETGSGSLTTKLPYTFPQNSHDVEYKITYSTSVSGGSLGNSSVTNTGTMTPGNGRPGVSSGVQVNTGNYNPLDKAAMGVALNGRVDENGNKLADYIWTVTIDATDGNIEPYAQNIAGNGNYWYYGDELWNEPNHWMTGAQIRAMAASLGANYHGRYDIFAYVWTGTGTKFQTPVSLNDVSDNGKYGQFRILFYDTLPQGQKITFTYSSTGQVGDGTASRELANRGTVNESVFDQAGQTYRPVVTKVDKHVSGNTTEHNINDSRLTFKNGAYTGVLGWNVDVYIPNVEFTQDLIIIEDIPDGTQLLDPGAGEWSLSFSLTGFSNDDFKFNGGTTASLSGTVNDVRYIVNAEYINGAYRITVPAGLANARAGQTIRLEVRVQIDKGLTWDEVTKAFKNTVTVTTGDTQLGEASQTQIIRNPIMDKSIGNVDDNIVPYTLEINPSGNDLLPEAAYLTLTDVLSFAQPSSGTVNALLLMNTVKVYSVDAEGNRADITANCPYTFEEGTDAEGKTTKTITMTIPDSQHLIVEYSYRLSGAIETSVELHNMASLEGLGKHLDDDNADYKVTIQKSSAGAVLEGIKIIKVDAENYALRLVGATFDLEEWDGTQYVHVETYKSGDDGTISTGELKTDVAYRFIETNPPVGYALWESEPYYFYIAGSEELTAPADFDGNVLNKGDSVYIANVAAAYELPETGGAGTYLYTTAGLLLMLASTAYLMYNKKRRKEVP